MRGGGDVRGRVGGRSAPEVQAAGSSPTREQPAACSRMQASPLHRPTTTHRSEPARSTKDSLPRATFWVCRLVDSTQIVMMRCERDDSRFICGQRVEGGGQMGAFLSALLGKMDAHY